MKKIIFFLLSLILILPKADAFIINGSKPRRIMCVGDSITFGSLSSDAFGYRKRLQDDLGIGNFQLVGNYEDPVSSSTYYIQHAGYPGDQTADVNTRIDAALDSYLPPTNHQDSAVLLHIGTNDVKTGGGIAEATAVDTVADSTLSASSIIGKIHAHDPNIDVYVALIIPSTDGTNDAAFSSYNTALTTRITAIQKLKSNVYIVDQNAAFKNTANCATVSACMADSLHPNDAGYRVMADTWATGMKNNGLK